MRLRTHNVHRLHVLAASNAPRRGYTSRNDVTHLLLAGRAHDAWARRSTVGKVLIALRARRATAVSDELRALASLVDEDVLAALARLLDARGAVLARAIAWPDRGRAFVQLLWEHGETGVIASWLTEWCAQAPGWTWLARAPRAPSPPGPQRAWTFPRPVGEPCLGRIAGAALAQALEQEWDDGTECDESLVYWWRRSRTPSRAWRLRGRHIARVMVAGDLVLAWDGRGEVARLDTRTGRELAPLASTRAPITVEAAGWYVTQRDQQLQVWCDGTDSPLATVSADAKATILPGGMDARWFLIRDATGLRSWTNGRGEATLVDDPRRARFIAVSNGDRALIAGTRTVRFIDVRSGMVCGMRDVHKTTCGAAVKGCAVRADGLRGAAWTTEHVLLFEDDDSPVRIEAIPAVRSAHWVGGALVLERANDVPVHLGTDGRTRALTELDSHACAAACDTYLLFRSVPRPPPAQEPPPRTDRERNPPRAPVVKRVSDGFIERIMRGEGDTCIVTEGGEVRGASPPDAVWPLYVARAGANDVVTSAPAGRSVHAWNPLEHPTRALLVRGLAQASVVLANGDALVIVRARLHHVDLALAVVRASIELPSGATQLAADADHALLTDGVTTWSVATNPLRLEPTERSAPPRRTRPSGLPSHRAPLDHVRWYDEGWWFTAGDDGNGHVLCYGPSGVAVLHAIRDGRPWHADDP